MAFSLSCASSDAVKDLRSVVYKLRALSLALWLKYGGLRGPGTRIGHDCLDHAEMPTVDQKQCLAR